MRRDMAVHKLSMLERKPGDVPRPHPTECREHHDAGRLPVYHGTRLVAYVDREEDLPEARFVERDGRVVGGVDRWT
jgi:hypothetical protein